MFNTATPSESCKKRRKVNSGTGSVPLEDVNSLEERRRHREGDSRKTPGRRGSFGVGGYIAASMIEQQQLQTAAAKPLSPAELERLQDHCVKMCSECRITIQNSWELRLIDYLQEVCIPLEQDPVRFCPLAVCFLP
eukprot:RCo033037